MIDKIIKTLTLTESTASTSANLLSKVLTTSR